MPKKSKKDEGKGIAKPHIIGQGSFGCIYHPGMTCNHEPLDAKYITKIHATNEQTAKNEIAVSKKIQKIPDYISYFSPVLESCKVNLAKVNKEEVEKCTFIKEDIKTKRPLTYITTKIRYISGKTLLNYIEDKTNITILYFLYDKLCKSVDKLIEQNIVHFDLRENNMIVTKQGQPIIIDFGISIDFSTIKKKHMRRIFYAYTTKYKPWCIEIVLISYMVHQNITEVSVNKAMEIFDEVMQTNNFGNIPYLKEALSKYREHFKTQKITIENMLSTYKRWDYYSVAIMLIQMLEKTGQTPNQTYIDKIKENLGFK